MKTYFECLPCFINQALGALKNGNATEQQIENAMCLIFSELSNTNFDAVPPVLSQKIHRIISKTIGNKDLYAGHKQRYNLFAENLLVSMQNQANFQQNNFELNVKLSIAANIIDFGKNHNLTEDDVLHCFEKVMDTPIDFEALKNLREAILSANNILFLCDNAGEIVFDRYLIEELPYCKITCAVRGMPVINDATMEDAQAVGLTKIVKVISNGSDAPGTILYDCSSEFRQHFEDADIIIAKGQGNFETLSSITDKRIFFLFQVKCPVIARDAGYSVGSFVVLDNKTHRNDRITEYSQSIKKMEVQNG